MSNAESGSASQEIKKTVVGVVVYPGFEVLDVFGPVEFFNSVSWKTDLSVIVIGPTVGPISSQYPKATGFDGTGTKVDYSHMASQSIVSQYNFQNAPHIDIMLVPGGLGVRAQEDANDTSVQDFVRERYPSLKYLLSVCNGAIILARSGLLDGRKATSNKALWNWSLEAGPKVNWQPSARWVEDGNIWTSSGVTAGMDMAYRFISVYWGAEVAVEVANIIEYAPHTDASWDPFSVIHKLPGADYSRSLIDSVGPPELSN